MGAGFPPKFLFGPKIRGAPGPSPGSATTQSVGGPEQGSQRCFAGVTSRGLVTSVTLRRADYIGLSFTLENFPDNHPSCPHSWSITLYVTPLKAYPTVS